MAEVHHPKSINAEVDHLATSPEYEPPILTQDIDLMESERISASLNKSDEKPNTTNDLTVQM